MSDSEEGSVFCHISTTLTVCFALQPVLRSSTHLSLVAAVAVVMIDLVADYGVEYLFYAVMLAGIIQASFGALGGGALVRMIPHPVMVGFVNGLGIVIGLAQFNSFKVQDSSNDSERRLETRRLGGGAFTPFTNDEEVRNC